MCQCETAESFSLFSDLRTLALFSAGAPDTRSLSPLHLSLSLSLSTACAPGRPLECLTIMQVTTLLLVSPKGLEPAAERATPVQGRAQGGQADQDGFLCADGA